MAMGIISGSCSCRRAAAPMDDEDLPGHFGRHASGYSNGHDRATTGAECHAGSTGLDRQGFCDRTGPAYRAQQRSGIGSDS